MKRRYSEILILNFDNGIICQFVQAENRNADREETTPSPKPLPKGKGKSRITAAKAEVLILQGMVDARLAERRQDGTLDEATRQTYDHIMAQEEDAQKIRLLTQFLEWFERKEEEEV